MAHVHKTNTAEFTANLIKLLADRKTQVITEYKRLCNEYNAGMQLRDQLYLHIEDLATLPANAHDGLYVKWHSEAVEQHRALSNHLDEMREEIDALDFELGALNQLSVRGSK
jgi:prophage DNA circulation protein